jgi:membrane protein DedA with SNARE-associated domain
MQGFLHEYGLWAVFFGTMIEGDLTLLFSGVMAHAGVFTLPDALLVGTAGGFTGDLVGYLAGQVFRSKARTLKFFLRAKPRLERLVRRFGGLALFIVKYTWGLRSAMSVFCGLAHFGFSRFAPLTLLSCATWSTVLAMLGYSFSGSVEKFIGDIGAVQKVLLVIVVLVGGLAAVRHLRARKDAADGGEP